MSRCRRHVERVGFQQTVSIAGATVGLNGRAPGPSPRDPKQSQRRRARLADGFESIVLVAGQLDCSVWFVPLRGSVAGSPGHVWLVDVGDAVVAAVDGFRFAETPVGAVPEP
jgi:hypothetical protein